MTLHVFTLHNTLLGSICTPRGKGNPSAAAVENKQLSLHMRPAVTLLGYVSKGNKVNTLEIQLHHHLYCSKIHNS